MLYETYRTEKLSRTVHSDAKFVHLISLSFVRRTKGRSVIPLFCLKKWLPRVSVSRKNSFAARKRRFVDTR